MFHLHAAPQIHVDSKDFFFKRTALSSIGVKKNHFTTDAGRADYQFNFVDYPMVSQPYRVSEKCNLTEFSKLAAHIEKLSIGRWNI